MRDASLVILYEVYPQLDALGIAGVARILGAFNGIEEEAERVAQSAFEEYGHIVGEGDMGDFADSARDQGIQYYQTLSELKQGVTNLLAVGLYHLFEQHRKLVDASIIEHGKVPPDYRQFASWTHVDELRLLANAVKHADGNSAEELRKRRPDYFVEPLLRGAPSRWLGRRRPEPIVNPMGGTDLFVTRTDLSAYRDALREFWEEAQQHA